ncbi:hypothetical protein KVR01_012279 [Diaporthe batatas]|uniref:uncharacterized protein n=1 Tax=Diaporthe batatas TaxID=748121 RepID=UPI001D04E6EA|nr:uncharacterized protein KVR01_012279 [Diaporthe batatas]KAG8158007.1 hypothetical protein KVR01_012279 [Diaporthe batatas]
MPRLPDRIGAKTQKILRSLSIERQDFGRHWDEIQTNRNLGRLSDVDFDKLCMLVAIAKQCGVPADEFSRRELHKAYKWSSARRSTERKMRKLCAKVHDRIEQPRATIPKTRGNLKIGPVGLTTPQANLPVNRLISLQTSKTMSITGILQWSTL